MSNRRFILEVPGEKSLRNTARLLSASSAKYGGDWHSIPHTHSYTELFYTVGGKGQYQIEDTLYPVKPNDLVIIHPDVVHTEVSYNANPLEYIVLGIDGLELTDGRDNGHFCILKCPDSSDILGCLRSILWEMEGRKPGCEEVCQALMEILIIRLMRNTDLAASVSPHTVRGSNQCAAIRRYLDTHFKESLNLDLLAREAHINKYYLAHIFKEEYGLSPINYLISRRIDESRYLLRETNMSVSQIARVLGFSSASYFSQSFRRAEGISPIEYRKKQSGGSKS